MLYHNCILVTSCHILDIPCHLDKQILKLIFWNMRTCSYAQPICFLIEADLSFDYVV